MGNLVDKILPPGRYNLDEEIINSTIKSLEEIQTTLDGINEDRGRYFRNYKKWEVGRRRTLSALQKCQNELDTIHLYSSAGRAIGSAAAVLGGVATVVGFGLSFSRDLKPLGNELMKYGSTVGTAGGATSVVASVAGKGFSAKVLREVKLALEEDQRLTENLLPWFRRAAELENLFQEVFDCSVVDGISDVLIAVKEISVLITEGNKTLTDITNYLALVMRGKRSPTRLRNLNNAELENILCNASDKVTTLLLGFCQSRRVQEAIASIYTSFKRSPDLFGMPKVTSSIIRQMVGQENALCSVISLTGGARPLINWTQGIFQAIGVLANVYAFLAAVEDIKEGKSKYSKIIEETKKCLLIELKTLESYPELRITAIK